MNFLAQAVSEISCMGSQKWGLAGGGAENAGVENAGVEISARNSKKRQGVENAGVKMRVET